VWIVVLGNQVPAKAETPVAHARHRPPVSILNASGRAQMPLAPAPVEPIVENAKMTFPGRIRAVWAVPGAPDGASLVPLSRPRRYR
jgi:hypothetical protein